uniref:superoxide dismutase n=1 Tax=Hyphantria cunea TaxID=39466 RepID=O96357_HYPCU|nr:putative Cu/Zn-superoxide dismutase [Hyphantria cunea]
MIKTLVFLASATVLVFAHNVPQIDTAVAHLEGKFNGAVVKGDLIFTMQSKDKMVITGKITGMPPGKYGLNIHEKGDLTNGCANVQGHLNPHGHDHGHPNDQHRHVGDLGNIEFDKSGVAVVKIEDHLVKLWGTEGIIGRSIALASQQDDHGKTEHPLSKVDGNTGALVACGVIGIK